MVFESADNGVSWRGLEATFLPDSRGIRAARFYAGQNYGPRGSEGQWPEHYVNAIYSDDHGHMWQTSDPVPSFGFGEAAIAERVDGMLELNIRRHWAPRGTPKHHRLCRWSSTSTDSGHTWSEPEPVLALPDGSAGSTYGPMGGLVKCGDVHVFSNALSHTEALQKSSHTWSSASVNPDHVPAWTKRRRL